MKINANDPVEFYLKTFPGESQRHAFICGMRFLAEGVMMQGASPVVLEFCKEINKLYDNLKNPEEDQQPPNEEVGFPV